MANDGDGSAGCGCLILFVILCIVGGGVWQGIGLAAVGWIGMLVVIGVSIGIVVLIVRGISGL